MNSAIRKLSEYFQHSFSSGMLSILLIVAAMVIVMIAISAQSTLIKALVLAYIVLP